MKKYTSIILTLTMLLTIIFPSTLVSATVFNTEDPSWYWTYNNSASGKLVTLYGYKGTNTDLTAGDFPTVVDGTWFKNQTGCDLAANGETDLGNNTFAVEAINSFYYKDAPLQYSDQTKVKLTSIELPYGPKVLSDYSFKGQNLLTKIFLPDSITTVGSNAFIDCTALSTVVMPVNLSSIAGVALRNIKPGANIYFRSNTAPSTPAALLNTTQSINVFYPQGGNLASFQAMNWGTTGTVTYTPYTQLPADAVYYYQYTGSGNTDPNASPKPSPSPFPSPTPTPSPSPVPSLTPINPIGFGASFSLFPSDVAGINVSELSGAYLDANKGVAKGGTLLTGQYTITNAAPFLNANNGITTINVASNGTITKSSKGACYGRYDISVKGSTDTTITYIPRAGMLKGVDTKVTLAFQYSAASITGIDAEIKYDGGKTKDIDSIVPDGAHGQKTGTKKMIEIPESFTNLESVTLKPRGTTDIFIPSLLFVVSNDNPGTAAPDLRYRKYVQPNLATVTPGIPVPLPTPNTDSPISINEVCSDNLNGIIDKNNQVSDWIELYNNSDAEVNISNYKLSDSKKDLNKWSFPGGTVVPPKGYLLVFASSSDTSLIDGEIHTNFSITKGGEAIMLSNADGGIISVIDLPALDTDKTMARIPDGSNNLKVTNPTPGSTNNAEIISSYVSKPKFSAESGFYNTSFDLTLSSQGSAIYYTTDGSTPDPAKVAEGKTKVYQLPLTIVNRTSEDNYLSSLKYTVHGYPDNPIIYAPTFTPSVNVDKSMIVRAVAVDSQGFSSEVVTKSYFVGYNMKDDFNNTAVLSVVTDEKNLFDNATGIFSNPTQGGSDWERRAHIDFFEGDGTLAINQDCGIRPRGGNSAVLDQKGLNFYAHGEYGDSSFDYPIWGSQDVSKIDGSPVTSFDNFCIRTGDSRVNKNIRFLDASLQRISSDLDMAWQSSRLCSLFINGEYWGNYYIQERVSTDYVEEHYGIPKENVVLVKNKGAKGDTTDAELQAYFDDMNWLNNTDFSVPANYAELDRKFDIKNMMLFYATQLGTANRDLGDRTNLAVWRSRNVTDKPYEDGKWRFMMYDSDAGYPNEADDSFKSNVDQPAGMALRSNPTLRIRFINALCDVFYHTYDTAKVSSELHYWNDELSPLAPGLEDRWGIPALGVQVAAETSYVSVAARSPYYYQLIKDEFNLTGDLVHLKVKANDSNMGTVKVNDIKTDFSEGRSYTGTYFNDVTQSLTAVPNSGYIFTGWTKTDGTVLSSETDKSVTVKVPSNGSVITANFAMAPIGTHYISTAAELTQIAQNIADDPNWANDNYVLTDNIELDEADNNFTPIGTALTAFNGTFDGQGHTISGIKTNLDLQGQGLFGYVGLNGVVRNVGVINCDINGSGDNGKNIGAIVGNNAGLIENCYSIGTVSGLSTVGGITGNNSGGTVRNCYSIATVNSKSTATLGGVAGKVENSGTIKNCYSLITPVLKIEDGCTVESTSAKTEEEFANGTVTNLLNGTLNVWKQGTIVPEFANGTVETGVTYIRGTISVCGIKNKNNVTVAAASYDGNKLVDIALYTIAIDANGNGAVTLDNDFTAGSDGKIKILLLDNAGTLAPLCNSIVVTK